MSQGISLHVGLNRIDPAHYGTDGALAGCENDANAMRRIASSLGYTSTTLLTTAARAEDILAEIRRAAVQLEAGDSFFFTYSGHGSQIPDTSGDELDQKDETFCVYDRMILDDELFAFWPSFRPGVLVVLVADSCHSATAFKGFRPRMLPEPVAAAVHSRNRFSYDSIRSVTPRPRSLRRRRSPIGAGIVSLAACHDDQWATDGEINGLFTENLLRAWDEGRFTGGYLEFISAIRNLMPEPEGQTPVCEPLGATGTFLSGRPFAIPGVAQRPSNSCQAEPLPIAGSATPTPNAECEHGEQITGVPSRHQQVAANHSKENNMQTFVDNGNWEEVAAALSHQVKATRGGDDFMSQVIATNAGAAENAYFASESGREAGVEANRGLGGSMFRVFWWGHHVQLSHEDLNALLNAIDPYGALGRFFRTVIPPQYQVWIPPMVSFVIAGIALLRGLDRGRGIYISMSFFVPGIFVPTSV